MEKVKKFIPLIIGVVLIGAAVFFYFRAGELARVCTEKTTATVVNMREEMTTEADSNEIRYLYYPVIEYEANGSKVKGELGSGSNPPAYSVNDTLEVLYNPNKTSEFIVAGENQYFVVIILGGIGVIFALVGIYLMLKK